MLKLNKILFLVALYYVCIGAVTHQNVAYSVKAGWQLVTNLSVILL